MVSRLFQQCQKTLGLVGYFNKELSKIMVFHFSLCGLEFCDPEGVLLECEQFYLDGGRITDYAILAYYYLYVLWITNHYAEGGSS